MTGGRRGGRGNRGNFGRGGGRDFLERGGGRGRGYFGRGAGRGRGNVARGRVLYTREGVLFIPHRATQTYRPPERRINPEGSNMQTVVVRRRSNFNAPRPLHEVSPLYRERPGRRPRWNSKICIQNKHQNKI